MNWKFDYVPTGEIELSDVTVAFESVLVGSFK